MSKLAYNATTAIPSLNYTRQPTVVYDDSNPYAVAYETAEFAGMNDISLQYIYSLLLCAE